MASMLKSYIIGKAATLCADAATPGVEPIVPIVATDFTIEQLPDRLSPVLKYKEDALQATDFESFLTLLDRVMVECGLIPVEDQTVVAAILNHFRLNAGLAPL